MNRSTRYSLWLLLISIGISLVINVLAIIATGVFTRSLVYLVLAAIAAAAVAGVLITYFVATTSPVLLDWLMTYRRLLRLDTLSHPLLTRLHQEAPATFQHSLQVGNLANRAAKAIKADASLARIGGYYHDIGKLGDPDFFIENSGRVVDNPQAMTVGELKTISARIQDHIKQGVELLKESGFPDEIMAFVPQHHGTMPIAYFFKLAKQQNKAVSKSDFYYSGPRPLSKEAAILMICDAVESKTRTLPETNRQTIAELINQVIEERQQEKQFELSGLTEVDLDKIAKALVDGVLAVHHKRINYPTDEKSPR